MGQTHARLWPRGCRLTDIRAAATIVLLRTTPQGPAVLMGQRGAGAAFMPSKYVFPGGAVDPADTTSADGDLPLPVQRRLTLHCPAGAPSPATLTNTARRELHEETGLALPANAPLQFIFRAITPPGRSRRFDARFFMADAADLTGNPDSFAGDAELSHLHWVLLSETRILDLPFITEVVLAEVTSLAKGADQPGVPFFDNSGDMPTFRRLT
jgi:8-oxo-dGTP pyrophosphatase MutT (NUDIX family)